MMFFIYIFQIQVYKSIYQMWITINYNSYVDDWVVVKNHNSHFVKFKGMSTRCMVTMTVIGIVTGIKIVKLMDGDSVQSITIKIGNIICIEKLDKRTFYFMLK